MKNNSVIFLITIFIAMIFITNCDKNKEPVTKQETETVKNVKVQPITKSAIKDTISLPGDVYSLYEYNLSAESTGKVIKIHLPAGSKTKGKNCILEVNTDILLLSFEKAKIDYELAKNSFKRLSNIQIKSSVSKEEYDRAENTYKAAEVGFHTAKIQYDKGFINTPNTNATWVVDEIKVKENEFVVAGTPIIHVLSLDKLKIIIKIPERIINSIKMDDEVKITFDSNSSGKEFTGIVKKIGYNADIKSKTFPIEVYVDNTEELIRPGVIAKVHFNLNELNDVVVIPLAAIVTKKDNNYIFVEKNGVAIQRQIVKGIYDINSAQITIGAEEGESLIVEGQNFLNDGEKVNIITG